MAIAIVSFRSAGDVRACLDALAVSSHRDFEVVVWENGGEAAFRELQAVVPAVLPGGQPVVVVLSPDNLGYAGGVNGCLRTAPDAEAWWVLNPDTTPEPDTLDRLVARLDRGDCDAVGCAIYLPDGAVQSYGGRWGRLLARGVSLGYGAPAGQFVATEEIERQQNYLNGAAMLVGRRFVDLAGPMREDYFLYCEEVEWCLRARARGARLGFASDAGLLHQHGASTGNAVDPRARSRVSVYLNERNRLLLTRDCFPRLVAVAALGAFLVLSVRYLRRGAWRQWRHAVAGWLAGLRDRRGVPDWFATGSAGGN